MRPGPKLQPSSGKKELLQFRVCSLLFVALALRGEETNGSTGVSTTTRRKSCSTESERHHVSPTGTTSSDSLNASFVWSGGEVGELLRAGQFHSDDLGNPGDWPVELQNAVNLCVGSYFPALIYWGKNLSMFYNDALVPLVGRERHPWALGRPAYEVFAEIRGFIEPIIEKLLETGESSWTENLMLPIVREHAPSEAYFSYSYTPIRDAQGETKGIYCTVIETTQQVIDERRLRLLSALHELNGASSVREAGSQLARELGNSREDIPFAFLYHTDRDGEFVSLMETVGIEPGDTTVTPRWRVDEGAPWPLREGSRELLIPFADRARPAVLLPLVQTAEASKPLGFLVAGVSELLSQSLSYGRFHDLLAAHVARCLDNAAVGEAQRKHVAELTQRELVKSEFHEAQRRREQSYRNLVQAPFPVAILRGPEHVVELANAHILQAWSKTTSVIGLPLVQAIPELEGQPFIGYLDGVYASGQARAGSSELARFAPAPGGELEDHYFNFIYAPLEDDSGAVDGILVAAFDVTDNVKARAASETARTAALEAENTQRALSEFQERFMGVLGHDLRGPLAAIDMGAGMLAQRAEETGDELGTRALARVLSSTRRMERMVNQLLDVTRIRIGEGLAIQPEPMDLCAALHRILDEVRVAHPNGRFDLDCDSIEGSWDVDRLEQVFANLLSNANHHGDPSRPVTVTARWANEMVCVEVSNYGTPIPSEVQKTLFDAFRRGERESRGANASGLGLGLYISREIVLAHQGTLDVTSSVSEGTTFSVCLPKCATAT